MEDTWSLDFSSYGSSQKLQDKGLLHLECILGCAYLWKVSRNDQTFFNEGR